MMKNAIHFLLNALFILKIFDFLSWFMRHVGNRFNKKAKANFKIYDVETEKQIITIDILANISRSRSNQTMKFSQLIEYSVRNLCFKNHTENEAGRLVPGLSLFLKKLYSLKKL